MPKGREACQLPSMPRASIQRQSSEHSNIRQRKACARAVMPGGGWLVPKACVGTNAGTATLVAMQIEGAGATFVLAFTSLFKLPNNILLVIQVKVADWKFSEI